MDATIPVECDSQSAKFGSLESSSMRIFFRPPTERFVDSSSNHFSSGFFDQPRHLDNCSFLGTLFLERKSCDNHQLKYRVKTIDSGYFLKSDVNDFSIIQIF
jgi:hypothetical protein